MSTPSQVIVYVWAQDILGNNIGPSNNAQFSVKPQNGFKWGQNVINVTQAHAIFSSAGYAQLQVVETQTPGVNLIFSISYQNGKTTRQVNFKPVIVPNQGAVSLTSITDIA